MLFDSLFLFSVESISKDFFVFINWVVGYGGSVSRGTIYTLKESSGRMKLELRFSVCGMCNDSSCRSCFLGCPLFDRLWEEDVVLLIRTESRHDNTVSSV